VTRRLAALLALTCALAAGGAGVATTAQQPTANASAFGISVVAPGQPGGGAAGVTAPGPSGSAASGGFVYPGDGSVVRTGSLSASVSAKTDGDPAAQAVADVYSVSLFNGEITFDGAAARATATPATADTGGSSVSNLVVLGQAVGAAPGARYALGDWGFLVTLEGGGERGATTSRAAVTAVRVTLVAEHAGMPPGTEISIGRADAATSTPAQPPATTAAPVTPAPPKPVPPTSKPATGAPAPPGQEPLPKPPEPRRGPPLGGPIVRPAPANIKPRLRPGGCVFPVYGPSSFTDTFGAARAVVTWHHGEDIFGPLGAPLLAVADGTVFSVGWNDIGGYRFWLEDDEGNQFYYAHLSAFSPLAVNGRRVKAGDVIGFMGNTGDAQSTPYHLHFEFHPVELLPMGYDGVVNPNPFLRDCKKREVVTFAASRGWAPPVPASASAPRPGAYLLGSSDISRASGLDPGALERALVAPVEAEGDGALLRSG
jgi:murein DD-endopeptidase MepM/ murein hydrolase activator NlpD